MIPKECKRLAEVDFPIAVVSKHAARERSIRQGNPSTLHLWWARRPLAACRSMLLALLLPDPCDENCPRDFKQKARDLLVAPIVSGKVGPTNFELRQAFLKFVGDFANSDLASDRTYLAVSRALVKAAHGEEPPLVVDPFAGGGSIPLEALRLGCDAFASDLNPVACLIEKTLLEDIPRYGSALAEELGRVGQKIKVATEKELSEFYPDEPDGAKPIAYLWARTVRCETPNCGAEIPLMRSFWLSKKRNRSHALRYKCIKSERERPHVEFETFKPNSDLEVPRGNVTRAKATCLCCQIVLSADRVRAQLSEQRGGADVIFDDNGRRIGGARLLVVVTTRPNEKGRIYRVGTQSDYQPVLKTSKLVLRLVDQKTANGSSVVPDESISLNEIRRISVPIYGATKWSDLWTSRNKLALTTYAEQIRTLEMSDACRRFAALAFDRLVMQISAHCRWKPTGESLIDMFGRHAIGMVWDFAEASPGFGSSSIFGGWILQLGKFIDEIGKLKLMSAQAARADACQHPLLDESCAVWFTDPPYYDSIPYAHLADCFYVWLKRAGLSGPGTGFDSELTPKDSECVVDRPHKLSKSLKDEGYFETKIADSAREGRRLLSELGIGCIVFAHKSTEGWEALLSGITDAGWSINASWPIATELASRLNARDTASLATSIHLVCRPRSENTIGDWAMVLRELPRRVGEWMERLQTEGVRGADLVFACIGPALEIYSQYEKVVDAEEHRIPLGGDPEANEAHKRGYLAYVWEVVGRTALEQILGTAEAKARNGAAGALEEDARLTALFLWTLQSTNGKDEGRRMTDEVAAENEAEAQAGDEEEEDEPTGKKKKGVTLIYDVARRFAQPLGIHLEDWEDRIIETKKGIVRLLPVSERAKQLFGEEGMQMIASELERGSRDTLQISLFPDMKERVAPKVRGRRGRRSQPSDETSSRGIRTGWDPTTLDRVHAAMLLQSSGRANALRALLEAEQERGPDFLRLANALSALYPKLSEEKRLLDAMLLAAPK